MVTKFVSQIPARGGCLWGATAASWMPKTKRRQNSTPVVSLALTLRVPTPEVNMDEECGSFWAQPQLMWLPIMEEVPFHFHYSPKVTLLNQFYHAYRVWLLIYLVCSIFLRFSFFRVAKSSRFRGFFQSEAVKNLHLFTILLAIEQLRCSLLNSNRISVDLNGNDEGLCDILFLSRYN